MELQNGYKVMYEARERVSEEKPGPLYAGKDLPALTDAMLISFDNAGNYVDCKSFKLIYSDGKHLFGSLTGIPADDDTNIILKGNDEVVFGEAIEEVEEPVVDGEHTEDTPIEEA